MSLSLLVAAVLLLAIERVAYVWVARDPRSFLAVHALVGGSEVEPTRIVERLFALFKLLQASVFAAWIWAHGDGAPWPPEAPPLVLAIAALAIAVGQSLNVAVFRRLGRTGVFYGDRFGAELPWVESFPFTVCPHPQYAGTVLTIWGVFMVARFPQPDWWVLPALETVYYAIGARLES